jgi:hypothetical protein
MTDGEVKADDLRTAVRSVTHVDRELQLVVRLENRASRALHYIADVRAVRYDAANRRLRLALSDEGRALIPTTVQKVPVFRHIDPGATAEIVVKVPDRIVKLSRNGPPGELAFETHPLSEIDEVEVEIGWADVPFYPDTRPQAAADQRMPAARWEQHHARAMTKMTKSKKR